VGQLPTYADRTAAAPTRRFMGLHRDSSGCARLSTDLHLVRLESKPSPLSLRNVLDDIQTAGPCFNCPIIKCLHLLRANKSVISLCPEKGAAAVRYWTGQQCGARHETA
jgi:hypothetical protein